MGKNADASASVLLVFDGIRDCVMLSPPLPRIVDDNIVLVVYDRNVNEEAWNDGDGDGDEKIVAFRFVGEVFVVRVNAFVKRLKRQLLHRRSVNQFVNISGKEPVIIDVDDKYLVELVDLLETKLSLIIINNNNNVYNSYKKKERKKIELKIISEDEFHHRLDESVEFVNIISPPGIIGFLLGYPIIYHLSSNTSINENCLGGIELNIYRILFNSKMIYSFSSPANINIQIDTNQILNNIIPLQKFIDSCSFTIATESFSKIVV